MTYYESNTSNNKTSVCNMIIYALAAYGVYCIYDNYVANRNIYSDQNGYVPPKDLRQYHAVVPRHFEQFPIG